MIWCTWLYAWLLGARFAIIVVARLWSLKVNYFSCFLAFLNGVLYRWDSLTSVNYVFEPSFTSNWLRLWLILRLRARDGRFWWCPSEGIMVGDSSPYTRFFLLLSFFFIDSALFICSRTLMTWSPINLSFIKAYLVRLCLESVAVCLIEDYDPVLLPPALCKLWFTRSSKVDTWSPSLMVCSKASHVDWLVFFIFIRCL